MAGQRLQGFGAGPGGGLVSVAGQSWLPYVPLTNPTPAHPDYVSGHSTYSAAAAVLRMFTGSDAFNAFNHSVAIPARSLRFDPALPTSNVTLPLDTFSTAYRDGARRPSCKARCGRRQGGGSR